jgi:hypothetical protein
VLVHGSDQIQWLETTQRIQKIRPVKALPGANLIDLIGLHLIHGIPTTLKSTGSMNPSEPVMP